ncbi:MAG TPA: sulfurtransferase, partial [Steroidobacteraceae bacterium]|nr:sulfurtransferase [Steroidobacteraceae bacterium]
RALYAAGHLPGAMYADLNADLSAPPTAASGRHPLPSPATFEAWLRTRGVNRGSVVVAYDDGNAAYASRLWWMLRWVGHDEAFVLDGGLRRWTALGLPTDTRVPAPGPGDFVARLRPTMVVDAAQVLASIGDEATRMLDARGPERYRGEVEPIDPVAGHVPGARNHPFTTNLGDDGRFLPAAQLKAAFSEQLGQVAPRDAITMCGSGVTACQLLLAMEHAGLPGARLYAGSWSEWCRDPARPVARGAAP